MVRESNSYISPKTNTIQVVIQKKEHESLLEECLHCWQENPEGNNNFFPPKLSHVLDKTAKFLQMYSKQPVWCETSLFLFFFYLAKDTSFCLVSDWLPRSRFLNSQSNIRQVIAKQNNHLTEATVHFCTIGPFLFGVVSFPPAWLYIFLTIYLLKKQSSIVFRCLPYCISKRSKIGKAMSGL